MQIQTNTTINHLSKQESLRLLLNLLIYSFCTKKMKREGEREREKETEDCIFFLFRFLVLLMVV